jgi:hypothetical protein
MLQMFDEMALRKMIFQGCSGKSVSCLGCKCCRPWGFSGEGALNFVMLLSFLNKEVVVLSAIMS